MKKRILPIVAIVLALAAALGMWLFHENYLLAGGKVCPRNATELDLYGAKLDDPQKLAQLTGLQTLDLRATGLTVDQYEALQAALPECKIQWLLPFQNNWYPLDTAKLSIADISESEMALLKYLPQLQTVDATACTDYNALLTLQAKYPNCQVLYRVDTGAETLSQDAVSANLAGCSITEITRALQYLPKLENLNASGCTDYEALTALQAQYPNCAISYTVAAGGTAWPNTTEALDLAAATIDELRTAAAYLPQLKAVTLAQTVTDTEAMYQLQSENPHIDFNWNFDLYGVTVNNHAEEVDLSGIPMESVATVENALKYFTGVKKVIMSDCGISNEDMDAFNRRYPDTLIVWTVNIGPIRLRTDITYFMPYQYDYTVNNAECENLKYCTEIICLDMGHQNITRTDFLSTMTKMKYLVLADTDISDISCCANMPELVFAEFFLTNVHDYSPLLNCKKLEDLNASRAYPDDTEALCQMTWLHRLWIRGNYTGDRQSLIDALPNTTICFAGGSSTDMGWRDSPNYFAMRDILGMEYMTH